MSRPGWKSSCPVNGSRAAAVRRRQPARDRPDRRRRQRQRLAPLDARAHQRAADPRSDQQVAEHAERACPATLSVASACTPVRRRPSARDLTIAGSLSIARLAAGIDRRLLADGVDRALQRLICAVSCAGRVAIAVVLDPQGHRRSRQLARARSGRPTARRVRRGRGASRTKRSGTERRARGEATNVRRVPVVQSVTTIEKRRTNKRTPRKKASRGRQAAEIRMTRHSTTGSRHGRPAHVARIRAVSENCHSCHSGPTIRLAQPLN